MTNLHRTTLGSPSGLNTVGWATIVWGVILEEEEPVTTCQLSIHPSIRPSVRPGEGCHGLWKEKKRGEGKERLLHPNTTFFLLNPASFLPQSPHHPMCCRAQACPSHASPLPPRYHPSLAHSHQCFPTGALHCATPFLRTFPSPASTSEVPSTPELPASPPSGPGSCSPFSPQAPLVLLPSLPALLPRHLESMAVVPSLPCCPLMLFPPWLVESPDLSLGGLTDPVSVGEITIYGTAHPSGSSTRPWSHLSGIRVSRGHRARAGTLKVPNH